MVRYNLQSSKTAPNTMNRRTSIQNFLLLSFISSAVAASSSDSSTTTSTHRQLPTFPGVPTPKSELLVTTPWFGGCLDTSNDKLECAISPDYCSSTQEYLLPHVIERTLCHSPHHVGVGRCSAADDGDSCAPFATSCSIPKGYKPPDNTCSLVQDSSTNIDRLTHYPHCRVKQSVDPSQPIRCVLNERECKEGQEDYLPILPSGLPLSESCECHEVPTGMCYTSSSSAALAYDTTYCAIAEYDCPEGYTFMTATQLDTIANPPRVCRLCPEASLGNDYKLHETVVKSGGCFDRDGFFEKCALEATVCGDGSTYRSSKRMLRDGMVPCPADIFTGGECTSDLDTAGCTNKKDACVLSQGFEERFHCSLHSNTKTKEPTFFGNCREIWGNGGDFEKHRCVWDASECRVGPEEWEKAASPLFWFDGCRCEDVQTGACRDSYLGEYYCAVSQYGCAEGDEYISSLETKDKGLDCRLCQPIRMLPDPKTMLDGVGDSKNTNKESSTDRVIQPPSTHFNKVLMIAGTITGTIIFTLLGVVFWYSKRDQGRVTYY